MKKDIGYTYIRTEQDGEATILKPTFDILRNNRNGSEIKALVLESKDAANVIPITTKGTIIMVRQYRFGSRNMSLELPGGLIEAGENPATAVMRELIEETGYQANEVVAIGKCGSNPAYINGDIFHFLARNVKKIGAPSPDDGENLEVVEVRPNDLTKLILNGEIHHPHALSALCQVFDIRTLVL